MNRAVCVNTCQTRIEGKITYVQQGQTVDLDTIEGNENCFEPLHGRSIDFVNASEQELLDSDWKFAEANKAMQSAFGKSLTWEEGVKKSDVVEEIMDIRYRHKDMDISQLPPKAQA